MMPEKIITLLGVLLVTTGTGAVIHSWTTITNTWIFVTGIFAITIGILLLDTK